MTFEELVTDVRGKVASSPLDGTALYQFNLSGEEGGSFYVKIIDGSGQVQEGVAGDADLKVSMAYSDFLSLVEGKMSATAAFFSGKIKLDGDMSLALKLQSFLR